MGEKKYLHQTFLLVEEKYNYHEECPTTNVQTFDKKTEEVFWVLNDHLPFGEEQNDCYLINSL